MGTRNDDISLILAKAKKQGFLPDVKDEEVDFLLDIAKTMYTTDSTFNAVAKASVPSAPITAMMHKLNTGVESVIAAAVGDSTGAMGGSWMNLLFQKDFPTQYPQHNHLQRSFDSAYEGYSPITAINAVGSNGLRRLVSTGASTDFFFTVADSPETSPVGDIDVRFQVKLSALGATVVLGGKYDTATNNRSWFVQIDGAGKLNLFYSTDGLSGTQVTRAATVAIPNAAIGVPIWLRVTFDVDNGAGSNVVSFYYSTDNNAWNAIGTPITTAGVASIFDGTSATQFNARGGAANATGGVVEYYGMQLYTSLVANTRPVIDIITGLWHGYFNNPTFKDIVGNTVTVGTTGSTGNMQGSPILLFLNGSMSGSAIAYANDATRFPKLTPIDSSICFINYSHNEGSTTQYRTAYKQLADAIIAKFPDCGIIAVRQNKRYAPTSNITEHEIRGNQIVSLAASQRYALINAYEILESTGNQQQYINTDGIHPTIPATATPGYSAGAEVIEKGAWLLFSTRS